MTWPFSRGRRRRRCARVSRSGHTLGRERGPAQPVSARQQRPYGSPGRLVGRAEQAGTVVIGPVSRSVGAAGDAAGFADDDSPRRVIPGVGVPEEDEVRLAYGELAVIDAGARGPRPEAREPRPRGPDLVPVSGVQESGVDDAAQA